MHANKIKYTAKGLLKTSASPGEKSTRFQRENSGVSLTYF
jgi:hypothetical protein